MFIHHVFFYMAPDATEADQAALRTGIKSLTRVEGILQWHIGTPADTHRDVVERGYTFSWLAIFENAKAEAHYQTHPVHLEFINTCAHLWEKVVVYDAI